MEVVEVLAMNEKVQHVVALAADLHSGLNPVQFRCLEEFGALKSLEKAPFLLRLWPFVMEAVEYPTL